MALTRPSLTTVVGLNSFSRAECVPPVGGVASVCDWMYVGLMSVNSVMYCRGGDGADRDYWVSTAVNCCVKRQFIRCMNCCRVTGVQSVHLPCIAHLAAWLAAIERILGTIRPTPVRILSAASVHLQQCSAQSCLLNKSSSVSSRWLQPLSHSY